MSPNNALLLLKFDMTKQEKMNQARYDIAEIQKAYPTVEKLYWDVGDVSFTALGNVSAVFDTLNLYDCRMIFCGVCDDESSAKYTYAYIRELARCCGLAVISMDEVRRKNREGETT